MHDGGQRPLAPPLGARPFLDSGTVTNHGHAQDRRRREEDQGEFPVEPEQDRTHADEEQDVLDDLGDRLGQRIAEVVDVARDAGHHVASGTMVVELQREAVDVIEKRRAQLEHQRAAGAIQLESGQIRKEAFEHRQRDNQERDRHHQDRVEPDLSGRLGDSAHDREHRDACSGVVLADAERQRPEMGRRPQEDDQE